MTLLLSNEDVERALTHERALSATEEVLRELAQGQAINRPRSQTYMPVESTEHPGFKYRFKSQEGGAVGSGVWALRITSDMAGFSFTNGVKRRRILPVATGERWCGLVLLFDLEKIEPVAIMPDGVIQKMRVAAMSAVGAKYLAPENPRVLGLFGSGWQASAHVQALCALFPFEKVKVYSPNPEHCAQFCQEMSHTLERAIDPVPSAREVVDGSDVIQAATAAWDPVFDGTWIEKGMYVASIGGSDGSNKRREIDDETIRKADVYIVHAKDVARQDKSPDIWDAAQNGIIAWEDIHEIQELVAGRVQGRTRADQITLYNNNTGSGIQFAACGGAVLKRARELGLGRDIPTEWFLESVSP